MSVGDSSTFSPINGDRRQGRVGRTLYFAVNRLINGLPASGSAPEQEVFKVGDFAFSSDLLPAQASPSRILSNLFWQSLDWGRIEEELGVLNAVDIGCGKGGYYDLLQTVSSGRLARYKGVDPFPRPAWAERSARDSRCRFLPLPAERISEALSANDTLIFSQSALEHIKGDLACLRQVAEHLQRFQRPTLQIHLVPAPVCLDLYGLHGYRQYSRRALGRIAALFDGFSTCRLVALGGPRLASVHRQYISDHGDRRSDDPKAYAKAMREAMFADMADGEGPPVFYALLIHSHPRVPL